MGTWEITVKDLRLILKDRGALYTLLALPVVFIAILGVSTGQLMTTRDEMRLVKVDLVDLDHTELSEQVFRDLSTIGGLKVEKAASREQGMLQLQDGRSTVMVVLGKEFHERVDDLQLGDVFDARNGKLVQGASALDMQIETSSGFAGLGQLVEFVVMAAVMQGIAPEVARRSPVMSRMIDQMIERHRAQASSNGGGKTVPQAVNSGSSIIYQTLVPAFVVLFAFFLVNIMASSFINERALGTLRRMQVSRVSPVQLLLGKTLPFLIVSITQCSLLFISGKLMFGMSWGAYPFMLAPVVFCTAVSATGLGLLLATYVRTESQVASYATFLVVVLAGISGCYMPRDWLPELMKQISLATPHAWALIAYQELLTRKEPNLFLVCKCCGMLSAMGVICFALGSIRFRKMEYPS